MMADRPILMSGPMVRATWELRKSQTRRIAKVDWKPGANPDFSGWHPEQVAPNLWFLKCTEVGATIKTPYQIGDRLWVREAWQHIYLGTDDPGRESGDVLYRADLTASDGESWKHVGADSDFKWRSPIHMFRRHSRLTLTVTDVRVQRVQEISGVDAIAEGVVEDEEIVGITSTPSGQPLEETDYRCRVPGVHDDLEEGFEYPDEAFRTLWDSLNAKRGFGWDVNPWVAAYTFTVEKRNIDR